MNFMLFLQGLFVWALVGLVVALIMYPIMYGISRIYNIKLQKPLRAILMIVVGFELSYISQVILREMGFNTSEIFAKYQTVFVVVNSLFIASVMLYYIKKNYKRGSR